MTTRSYATGGAGRGISEEGQRMIGMLSQVVDMSVDNQTAADVGQMLSVLPGMWIGVVGLQILVLEGATSTIGVGDGTTTSGYISGANANTGTAPVYYSSVPGYTTGSGNVITATTAEVYGTLGGKLYTVADTVDAIFNNTVSVGKIRVTAMYWLTDGGGADLIKSLPAATVV